jgi:uncharacterized protein (DUF362 family)
LVIFGSLPIIRILSSFIAAGPTVRRLTREGEYDDNEELASSNVYRNHHEQDGRFTVDRREFLERVTAWSAGLSLAAPLFDVSSILAAEGGAKGQPVLVVAKGKDYEALVGKVLGPLGGIAAFVHQGDRVVVKPNVGWDRSPEQAANTHPEVVKTLVRQCLDAGASQVLVFDHTGDADARSCFRRSGIQAAVDGIGDSRARCYPIDPRKEPAKFIPVRIANGRSIKEFTFYEDALEKNCDCYINVPVAKHHDLAKLTLGLKNIMGVIGNGRAKIHRNLGESVTDLNLVVRPKLTVIDATRILLRHGPTGGNLDDVKILDTLIASTDIVAADAYVTTLFDMKPKQVPSTVAAAKRGLGEMDLAKVKIVNV